MSDQQQQTQTQQTQSQQSGDQSAAKVGAILTTPPEGGTQQADWRSSLPDDLKQSPSVAKFKDVTGLAKSYVEMEKLMGKPRIEAPQENWGEKEWSEFHSKLGRPATPKDYKFTVPDGMQRDEKLEAYFAEEMHAAGLNQKQAEKLHKRFVDMQIAQHKENAARIEAENNAALANMKKEWGDQYDAKIQGAFRAAKLFGGQELADVLNKTGLGNHPALVKMFAQIDERMSEDSVRVGKTAERGFTPTANDALAEIGALKSDENFYKAFNNSNHPGHKAAKEKWAALHKMAYPGKIQE